MGLVLLVSYFNRNDFFIGNICHIRRFHGIGILSPSALATTRDRGNSDGGIVAQLERVEQMLSRPPS